MASAAERRVIGILVLTELVAAMIYPNASKTVKGYAQKIIDVTNEAFDQWKTLEPREVKKIKNVITEFDHKTFGNTPHETVIYTSLLLGLIGETLKKISNREREKALDAMIKPILRLHRHFDRGGNLWPLYDKAKGYIAVWDNMQI